MTLQFNTGASWYPLFMSMSIFISILSFFMFLNFKLLTIWLSLIFFGLMSFMWYRDLVRESLYVGSQNLLMILSIKLGMVFMILSEVFFFVSFFWTFMHFMFMYSGEMGYVWPPVNINSVNYMSIPLLNTLILLSSGCSLTISHMFLLMSSQQMKSYLMYTIFLGLVFTFCQSWEYWMLDFLWSNSCFGSIFYMGTGFHGIHVIIGSLILIIVFSRSLSTSISSINNIFELGSWYWHFVDVVWIFLFSEFYWFSF
uniref:Cytochrome c oxidase subunit 3 n=1 Tax=Thaumamermis cosgrovei TaxID=382538 RepID=Q1HBD9_THACS|nr:cytochrome c oxidase subunit III [Thaumamermis cosgrovei]ABF48144.1 cytochrome c oxidase subunit 3 [Thaumamermis cosgrovei]ABF48156.1 cytochrome c oxidase subunit 3 [Thaumamermis cosgrovei]